MEALTIHQPGATLAKPNTRPPLSVIIEHFLYSQDVRPKSRSVYKRSIKQFFNWTEASGHNLDSLTRQHILVYKQYLLDKGLSPFTAGGYITALRLFFKFTEANNIYRNIATDIKLPRTPQSVCKNVLTKSEGKALLEYLTRQGPRNEAIGHVLIYCGLRTIEVSRLQVQDLTIKQGKTILKVHGKGRDAKDEYVTVNEGTLKVIKEYLATRPGALPGEPLFTTESNNNKGQHISTTTISTMIKEALRAIGLDDRTYTAHSLRHTFGVSLIKNGVPIWEVSKLMRHKSIHTTERYLRTIEDEMRLQNPGTDLINGLYD